MSTSWRSWTLQHSDATLDEVVDEAVAALPATARVAATEFAAQLYRCLDEALVSSSPELLCDFFVTYRTRADRLGEGVNRAKLLRLLCDVLGRHIDADSRILVNQLVSQTVLAAGQRRPEARAHTLVRNG